MPRQRWTSSLVLALFLVACQAAQPSPVVAPSDTPGAFLSPSPRPSLTPAPTSLPPTVTPPPASSPTPTAGPELRTALPGTVWSFEVVGHNALEANGSHGTLALQDDCAYVGSCTRPEVNIFDISDPTRPSHVGTIPLPNDTRPIEVRALPDRDLLVVADLSSGRKLFTLDVSDCRNPVALGEVTLARWPHEFFLWTDGSQVLAYVATFDSVPPNLLVIDLTDPAAPEEVARWTAADDGVRGIMHSLSVSDDGTTAYLAMWDGGFVVAEIDLPDIRVVRDEQGDFEPAYLANTHSAVPLADPRFVVLGSEVFGCPFGGLAIADISDPSHPEIVSNFNIPENRCGGLPAGDPLFTVHNPLVVDDLIFASWYAAGVQVVDVSDPLAPERVGQFVPSTEGAADRSPLGSYPVQTCSYPILRDGLFYVADIQSGLHVIRYTGPGVERLEGIPRAEGNVTILSSP